MPLCFLPSSRQMTKMINFRSKTYKWPTKYLTIRYRSSSNKAIKSSILDEEKFSPSLKILEKTTKKKGKLSQLDFHLKWSWKAGAGWTLLSLLDWWLLAIGGKWLKWSGLLLKLTPLGICMFAAMEWHIHNRSLQKQGLPRVASQFQTYIYCSLPLRLLSRSWGWLADCNIPVFLRPFIYGLYINMFNVNLDEVANPELKEYRSVGEFFTRSLKEDVRLIDKLSCLTSPADGTVLHFGPTTNSKVEQVKGITYSLDSFLGSTTSTENNMLAYPETLKQNQNIETDLYQCVIYLAPGDYHRFHSPAEWEPKYRRHFAGELLSVNPKIAQWMPGLFCINERVSYLGKWTHGFFSFTAVGATNVGSVQIYFDDKLKTNKWMGLNVGCLKSKHCDEVQLTKNLQFKKGDILGQFNMGSTIVLIFEAPKNFKFSIHAGQNIKMGEPIGCISDENINEKK